MKKEIANLIKYSYLSRQIENYNYNTKLHGITKFPLKNIYQQPQLYKLILNFSFKPIDFNKKRALPFFLAMELLTNQKCVATLSKKNVLSWKLRKGSLVGCKVTLRGKNLFDFLDSLTLALPRMEKFQGLKIPTPKEKLTNSVVAKLSEILLFYPIELGLGINSEVKHLEMNFIFNSTTKEEKKFIFSSFQIPTN
jgi:large subunit ribosomal protein L5